MKTDFDVVVIGGGSAGCAAASRLVRARLDVCLVEAGPDYGQSASGRWPADVLNADTRPETHDWGHVEQRRGREPAWTDRDLVFTNPMGEPVAGSSLQRALRAILERAKLPRIRFHDLRHTAATMLLGRGVHPKIASEMLGHSRIAVTLDLYSHVTPTMQREAVSAIEAALGR